MNGRPTAGGDCAGTGRRQGTALERAHSPAAAYDRIIANHMLYHVERRNQDNDLIPAQRGRELLTTIQDKPSRGRVMFRR